MDDQLPFDPVDPYGVVKLANAAVPILAYGGYAADFLRGVAPDNPGVQRIADVAAGLGAVATGKFTRPATFAVGRGLNAVFGGNRTRAAYVADVPGRRWTGYRPARRVARGFPLPPPRGRSRFTRPYFRTRSRYRMFLKRIVRANRKYYRRPRR